MVESHTAASTTDRPDALARSFALNLGSLSGVECSRRKKQGDLNRATHSTWHWRSRSYFLVFFWSKHFLTCSCSLLYAYALYRLENNAPLPHPVRGLRIKRRPRRLPVPGTPTMWLCVLKQNNKLNKAKIMYEYM